MPPTFSLRRISAKRCDSAHEPRVSRRRAVAIAESLETRGGYVRRYLPVRAAGAADRRIRLPKVSPYGIFTPGAPGSLVGSRTVGVDSNDGPRELSDGAARDVRRRSRAQ